MTENNSTSVKVVKSSCDTCGKDAETRLLTIKYPNVPPEVVAIFECVNCRYRDTSIFEYDETSNGKLRIECCLDTKDELQRYVFLNQDAKATFYDSNSEVIYELKTFASETAVIEMLLTKAIEKTAELCKISPEQAGKETGDSTLISASSDGNNTQVSTNSEFSSDKASGMKKIKMMRDELKNPKMKLVIVDASGKSRVGPPNQQFPPDFLRSDMEFYNDDKVKHIFDEKE